MFRLPSSTSPVSTKCPERSKLLRNACELHGVCFYTQSMLRSWLSSRTPENGNMTRRKFPPNPASNVQPRYMSRLFLGSKESITFPFIFGWHFPPAPRERKCHIGPDSCHGELKIRHRMVINALCSARFPLPTPINIFKIYKLLMKNT